MLRRAVLAAVLAAAPAARPARADVDVEVLCGDKVTGTILPGDEEEVFRFRVPRDAAVTVKAKAAKKGPELHVELRAPGDAVIGSRDGRSVTLAAAAGATGLHSVLVRSRDGAATGDYSLVVAWKSPRSFTQAVSMAPGGGEGVATLAADQGATATLAVRADAGSAADPRIDRVETADGDPVPGLPGPLRLPATTEYRVVVRDQGTSGGTATFSCKVKQPKPSKRKIPLTSKVVGTSDPDGDYVRSTIVGPGGGSLEVDVADGPGAAIDGSAVDIPEGALPAGTAIVIGTSSEFDPRGDNVAAGPPVYFGPEGLRFGADDRDARATVTIPIDPAYLGRTDELVVFTRDAQGRVSTVPGPYTFDLANGTVSFATSHFSSFRAAAPDTGGGGDVTTLAASATPRDVCLAHDPADTGFVRFYLVAEGDQGTVAAIGIDVSNPVAGYTSQLFAGGGITIADGTPRTDYVFGGPVQSVHQVADGDLYVATPTQVCRIDPQGLVWRFAGTGGVGDAGDDGPALSATFTSISDVVADSGTVYVADAGAHRIRAIDVSSGTISAWAGDGSTTGGADGDHPLQVGLTGPYALDLVLTAPGLLVADGERVRMMDPGSGVGAGDHVNVTLAGSTSGVTGDTGDGGPPSAARFRRVTGVSRWFAQDPLAVSFYVCDAADHTVRRVDAALDLVSLVAGSHGTAGDAATLPGLLDSPSQVLALGTVLVLCDEGNSKVKQIVDAAAPAKAARRARR